MARFPNGQNTGMSGRLQGVRINRATWAAGLLGRFSDSQAQVDDTNWQAARIGYGHSFGGSAA